MRNWIYLVWSLNKQNILARHDRFKVKTTSVYPPHTHTQRFIMNILPGVHNCYGYGQPCTGNIRWNKWMMCKVNIKHECYHENTPDTQCLHLVENCTLYSNMQWLRAVHIIFILLRSVHMVSILFPVDIIIIICFPCW